MKLSKEVNSFLEFVKNECKEYNVTLRLSKTKRVRSGGYVSGYFSESDLVIAVAMKSDEWLSTLVHEFCHMRQWKEDSEFWINSEIDDGTDAWDIMESHLRGEKVSQSHINQAYKIIIACERDCDMRAVKMMKKFNLPIDIKNYIKQANAYHYFYHCVRDTGKWYGKVPVYCNKKVLDLCPDNFRSDTIKKIPQNIHDAICEHINGRHGMKL